MDKQLVALYEVKRNLILSAFLNHPQRVDKALAYAYEHHLAPLLNEEIERERHGGVDPFVDVYAVKADFLEELLKFLDECWHAKKLKDVEFYALETRYRGKADRVQLIHALEYFRIKGLFDDAFYAAVESNAPTEAKPIESNFDASKVYFE